MSPDSTTEIPLTVRNEIYNCYQPLVGLRYLDETSADEKRLKRGWRREVVLRESTERGSYHVYVLGYDGIIRGLAVPSQAEQVADQILVEGDYIFLRTDGTYRFAPSIDTQSLAGVNQDLIVVGMIPGYARIIERPGCLPR